MATRTRFHLAATTQLASSPESTTSRSVTVSAPLLHLQRIPHPDPPKPAPFPSAQGGEVVVGGICGKTQRLHEEDLPDRRLAETHLQPLLKLKHLVTPHCPCGQHEGKPATVLG